MTIQMDVQTHLPLRRTFQWRDPVYKDKNTDAEEYDGLSHGEWDCRRRIRLRDSRTMRWCGSYYIDKVSFNQDLPADILSIDAAVKKIKKCRKRQPLAAQLIRRPGGACYNLRSAKEQVIALSGARE